MKKYMILPIALLMANALMGQISFFACPDSFTSNPNTYNFTLEGTDATGRNYYQTNDIDGAQSCEAGICEFRIAWSQTNSRWEVLLLQSQLDFSDATVIYYNSTASSPDPPSLNLGVWEDEASVCGGALTESNSTLSGSVQSTVLSTENVSFLKNRIQIYPNPAKDIIFVDSKIESITSISLYSILGEKVLFQNNTEPLDISKMSKGIYLIKVETETNGSLEQKLIVK